MEISSFDDLLRAARSQPEPQRLLFVFTQAALPADCTTEQRSSFEAGEGGTLEALMCTDKTPDEIEGFHTLLEESRQFGHDWSIVFVAALSGRNGRAPSHSEAELPLQRMIESIHAGTPGALIPFDRQGRARSLA